MQTTVVYGPAGCGKTTMSGAIAEALGLGTIFDEVTYTGFVTQGKYVSGLLTLPEAGVLALTESEGVARMFKGVRVLSFDEAVSQLW